MLRRQLRPPVRPWETAINQNQEGIIFYQGAIRYDASRKAPSLMLVYPCVPRAVSWIIYQNCNIFYLFTPALWRYLAGISALVDLFGSRSAGTGNVYQNHRAIKCVIMRRHVRDCCAWNAEKLSEDRCYFFFFSFLSFSLISENNENNTDTRCFALGARHERKFQPRINALCHTRVCVSQVARYLRQRRISYECQLTFRINNKYDDCIYIYILRKAAFPATLLIENNRRLNFEHR